jgi:hypothetical protein
MAGLTGRDNHREAATATTQHIFAILIVYSSLAWIGLAGQTLAESG